MKKSLLFIAGVLVLTGCVDTISDVRGSGTPEITVTSKLVVPASFDWKTTSPVACDFSSQAETSLSVALDAAAEPFATVGVGSGADPVSLDIPVSVRSLYVSYVAADGSQKGVFVPVSNDKVSFAVPADAASLMATRANNDYDNEINVPALENGWGTLMFEDLWPSYGDYDFNDFVLNYKMQLYANNKNMVRSMRVDLRVKAIGGTLPFVPRLRMLGLKGGEVSSIEVLPGLNVPDGAQLVQLNPGNNVKEPAVVEFRGISTKENRPSGAAYLNTERGYEMTDDELVTVAYRITFRNSVKQENMTFDSFDFYLADAEGKEIHLGGMEPTAEGMAVYQSNLSHGNISQAPKFYYSNDNLVWAINIPADVTHAYEKTDFLEAYPEFADWAQSGGAKAQTWYKNGVRANLVSARK